MAAKVFFISGTDTGCGKTLAAESLLVALKQRGLQVAGMKPVATGAEQAADGLVNSDAARLRAHSSIHLQYDEVNPYVFETACSPNFAAEKAGLEIRPEHIKSICRQLQGRVDVVVIEGIGGWRAPLSARLCAGDIARITGAQVIFVAGLKLGCINHTLLSIEAIKNDGIPLTGWVINQPEPGYTMMAETVRFLQSQVEAPLLGIFPCINNHFVSGDRMWEYLDVSAVL